MKRKSIVFVGISAIAASVAATIACASGAVRGATAPALPSVIGDAAHPQFLYVYNTGSPGVYHGEYARYSLPALSLLETTEATGVGSPIAFDTDGKPYFIDEAPVSGFGVYAQPIRSGVVPAAIQFSGIPCQSTSLSTGPTSDFYAVQYCSANVLEFRPGATKGGKPKKPFKTYTGGNLGGSKNALPTTAVVDHKGNLYVGDNGGGITFFAAGTTKAAILLPTGRSQYVMQLVVDTKDNVWSTHLPDPTPVYFQNEKTCVVDPSGTVVRYNIAERFSNGRFVQQLYSPTSDSSDQASAGLSIAVDAKGRAYVGAAASSQSVVLDYGAGQSCPNDSLSLILPHTANPQVAVDGMLRYYVTDTIDNTISAYKGGSKNRIARIAQATGLVNIAYSAINPP
jgi:hypothetical protein